MHSNGFGPPSVVNTVVYGVVVLRMGLQQFLAATEYGGFSLVLSCLGWVVKPEDETAS